MRSTNEHMCEEYPFRDSLAIKGGQVVDKGEVLKQHRSSFSCGLRGGDGLHRGSVRGRGHLLAALVLVLQLLGHLIHAGRESGRGRRAEGVSGVRCSVQVVEDTHRVKKTSYWLLLAPGDGGAATYLRRKLLVPQKMLFGIFEQFRTFFDSSNFLSNLDRFFEHFSSFTSAEVPLRFR